MPVNEDEFTKRTKTQVVNTLQAEMKSRFGNDIDLSENSVFSTIIESFADYIVTVHEPDLEDVFLGAFLDTATGGNLDNVVELLGVERLPSAKSSGVVILSRNTPATATYTVQGGTIIQTAGSSPIRFETIDSTNLHLFDSFEGTSLNSNYTGDTTQFGHNAVEVYDGNQSLEGPASGSYYIYRTDKTQYQGDTYTVRIHVTAGADCETWFFVTDQNNHYHLTVTESTGSVELNKDVAGTETTLDSDTITVPTGEFMEAVITTSVPDENGATDITVELYDASETLLTTLTATDSSHTSGGFGFASFGSKAYWDTYSSYATAANVEATEGGTDGNVSSETLVVLPVVPAGIQSVNNPHAVGNSTYVDLNGNAYVTGKNEETDDELRDRTRDSLGGPGASTIEALETVILGVDGVTSVKVYENNEDVADGDGMEPTSFEAVVFGGDDNSIAQAIFSKKAATAQDVAGHHGTAASGTAISSVTGTNFTINFSRPTEVAVDFTISIVTNANYIGDAALKDLIVEYVGGTKTDGTTVVGLDPEEDVILDQVKDVIVGPDDTGVESVPSFTTSPVATTDANGVDIVDVGSDSVATTDGTDGSISITVL